MALANQITQCRVTANGTNYDINLQNMDWSWSEETYAEAPTSIGGKKLVSRAMAGKRLTVSLNFERNIEPSTVNDMVDDIMIDFIYNNVESIDFYPDASSTSDSTLISASATATVTGGDQIDLLSNHNLKDGQYVEVTSNDIAGLSNGYYYVIVVDANSIKLSENINGSAVDGLTNASGRSITIVENRFVTVSPTSLQELQRYQNTVSAGYVPTLTFESIIRYVTTPEVFTNV